MDHIENTWVENASSKDNLLEYQNWFDTCSSLSEATSNGFIDFTHRIFTPDFYEYVGDPKQKTSLEIGFGGGRLINAANKFFDKSFGIDILDEKSIKMTQEFINLHGQNNVNLLNYNDRDIIKDKSIDFVYSFIVFQHFSSYSIIENYLTLIKRVLSNNGCGILYFGRNDFTQYDIYQVSEETFQDRECSLYVKEKFMVNEMLKQFDVIESNIPTKKLWNKNRSMQFYIKFKNK